MDRPAFIWRGSTSIEVHSEINFRNCLRLYLTVEKNEDGTYEIDIGAMVYSNTEDDSYLTVIETDAQEKTFKIYVDENKRQTETIEFVNKDNKTIAILHSEIETNTPHVLVANFTCEAL